MVALAEGDDPHRHQSTSRRLRTVSVKEILSVTSMEHGVEALDYAGFRSSAAGRDMAAWRRAGSHRPNGDIYRLAGRNRPYFRTRRDRQRLESRSPSGVAIERIGHLATNGKEDRNGPWLEHRR